MERKLNDTATAASVFQFGPGGAYLAYISDPSRWRSLTGVIMIGLGRLESRIARRLAALGLVVMQVQLFRDYADMRRRLRFYDDFGVAACAGAIEEMVSKRGVSRVVLMGDCAEANLCFNTALADARVVGLILTNPNLDAQLATLTPVERLPLRLFEAAHWRRVLAGDSKLLKSILRRLGSRSAAQWLAGQWSFSKDLILPLDFDQKLSKLLTERAGRCLIVFSKDRDGLGYLRRIYRTTIHQLIAANQLSFEVMPVNARDDPADDQAACQFADVIADWAGEALLPRAAQNVEAESSPLAGQLADWSAHATIVDRFEDVARLYPQRLALRDQARSLTYAQLAALAGAIAAAITQARAPAGAVGVLLAHEARFPAAILGVLAAGRICVPLDADHPAERNGRIARHSGVTLLIASAELAARARALFPAGLAVIDLDGIAVADPTQSATPLGRRARADDVACVLYTSGSTGVPKGVFQNHRGLLHDAMQSVHSTDMSWQDRMALFYPPCVIAGLLTLLTGLMCGATMEVLPPRIFGRTALAGQIRARQITELGLSPTLFRHLADSLAAGECFDDVRLVTLGGERVDWSDFDVFRRACPPQAKLRVHLGATECWTLHTEWKVDASLRASCPRLPVGRGIPGRRVDIVGEDGEPLADGEIGEVRVTSRYIALGYWREPELTASSFTRDPEDPLQRQYRTGDLVRRRADGLVEFIGRKDKQIKLHGYRIEPDEVEVALKACAGVAAAAVLVRNDATGLPLALAGYVTLQAGSGLSPDRITALLRERVPAYMMPAEIVILDELPWLPNFKIDRQRLAQIDAAQLSERAQTPSSPLIGELIQAFMQVTKAPAATPNDNILSLGGDSLQALELMLEIGRRFRVVVPEQAQDPTRTIAQWALDISAWRRLDAAQWTG
jgi:amino acid adenylation domain-containing protein